VTNQPPDKAKDPAEPDDGETWIVAANAEMKIRLRSLTLYLQRGGALNDVRLIEGADATWTMWVRLKDRPGEFRLNRFQSEHPKTYKDVALAVACCRRDFGYQGPITLITERIPGGPNGDAATTADRNFDSAEEKASS
jgi:hypothetical protein